MFFGAQVLKAQVLQKQIQQFKRTETLEGKVTKIENLLLKASDMHVYIYTYIHTYMNIGTYMHIYRLEAQSGIHAEYMYK
jgi:hypothetical protein